MAFGKYRGTKYGNIRHEGSASKKEHARKLELELFQKCGAIRNLEFQKRWLLIPKQDGERAVYYLSDASYVDCETGLLVVEDTKSVFTKKNPVYVLKRKMMLHFHGIRIREV